MPSQVAVCVQPAIYTWLAADMVSIHAYYVGMFDIGEEAARKALKVRPDIPRLEYNLKVYMDRKKT